jgi:hypothetical protein
MTSGCYWLIEGGDTPTSTSEFDGTGDFAMWRNFALDRLVCGDKHDHWIVRRGGTLLKHYTDTCEEEL